MDLPRMHPAGIEALRTIAKSGKNGIVYFGEHPVPESVDVRGARAAVRAYEAMKGTERTRVERQLTERLGLKRFLADAQMRLQ